MKTARDLLIDALPGGEIESMTCSEEADAILAASPQLQAALELARTAAARQAVVDAARANLAPTRAERDALAALDAAEAKL